MQSRGAAGVRLGASERKQQQMAEAAALERGWKRGRDADWSQPDGAGWRPPNWPAPWLRPALMNDGRGKVQRGASCGWRGA